MDNEVRRMIYSRCKELLEDEDYVESSKLSMNPNLIWEIIVDYPDKWYWGEISRNPCITNDIVAANPHLSWDVCSLLQNPNTKLSMIEEILRSAELPAYYSIYLSMNPNITWEFIQAHPEIEWEWWCISENPNITWDIIESDLRSPNPKSWDWKAISRNPSITWDIIKANLDKPWCWNDISSNPNITWDIVKANLDKPWCWSLLSRNPNITWDIIQANPDKPWDMFNVCGNPNITMDIVHANRDKLYIPDALSLNPNLTWEEIQSNVDCYWRSDYISANPGIIPVKQFRKQVICKYMKRFLYCKKMILPELAEIVYIYM